MLNPTRREFSGAWRSWCRVFGSPQTLGSHWARKSDSAYRGDDLLLFALFWTSGKMIHPPYFVLTFIFYQVKTCDELRRLHFQEVVTVEVRQRPWELSVVPVSQWELDPASAEGESDLSFQKLCPWEIFLITLLPDSVEWVTLQKRWSAKGRTSWNRSASETINKCTRSYRISNTCTQTNGNWIRKQVCICPSLSLQSFLIFFKSCRKKKGFIVFGSPNIYFASPSLPLLTWSPEPKRNLSCGKEGKRKKKRSRNSFRNSRVIHSLKGIYNYRTPPTKGGGKKTKQTNKHKRKNTLAFLKYCLFILYYHIFKYIQCILHTF